MRKILVLTLVSLTTAFVSVMASAQQVPTSAEPGRLQERFSKEKPAILDNQVIIQQEEQQTNMEAAEKVRFKLKSVTIKGNKIYSAKELRDLYKNKIGKEVSLADIYRIRDQITKRYRENGYILSRAVLPVQQFNKNGADVTIQIVEGFVSSVTLQGDIKGDRKLIQHFVDKIKQPGPLNSKNLERYLLLINDQAGTSAQAVIKPAASALGGADIIITTQHDYFNGVATIDNSGSKFVGPYLMTVEGNANSLLGLSEKVTVRAISDVKFDEIQFGEIGYKVPIGYEGTKLRLATGRTVVEPGASAESLNIHGDTKQNTVEVTHPFIRSRKENLNGRIGFVQKNTLTESSNLEIYHDKLSIFSIGGTFDYADEYSGVNLLDLAVFQGADIFNPTDAGDNKSRANGEAVFTKYTMEASRLQKLPGSFALLFSVNGQYSNEGLLASEEFGIGGRDYGRGYDFSEITGDAGIASKIELQYGFETGFQYLRNSQLYVFYDAGKVWQKDQLVGEAGSAALTSAGTGVRFNVLKDVSVYTEVSKPLTRDKAASGNDDVQFNFGISYLF